MFSNPAKAATYSVGPGKTYANLSTAFTAINNGVIQGAIVLQITGGFTETVTAELKASVSPANYSSVLIYPTATSTISSSVTNAAYINLNGADNVTIDGRLNQTGAKSLTISNTVTTGMAVRFIADATSNTIRYCNINGVNTSATGGVVVFSTASATGNDNNTIDYCDVYNGTTTPTNAIYSLGSINFDNTSNTISNCNIYNFFNAGIASNGIFLSSYNSAWTINNNKFYQTTPRNMTTSVVHRAINIVTSTGVGYNVSNNTIGYASSTGSGFMTYTSGFRINTRFYGIEMTVGTTTPSSIQGNVIAGIDLTNTLNTGPSAVPGLFTGISVLGGAVNIGTTTGNTIGGETGANSITLTAAVTLTNVAGIYATSSANIDIQNNHVGGINMDGVAAIGFNFHGINTAGTGSLTISANTIGSTSTANSIAVGLSGTTTTGVCTFNGITNATTGTSTVTNNIIQNCSVYGTGASIFNGIVKTGGTGTLDITGNSLIAGTNTGTGTMTGVSNAGAVSTLNINDNIIQNLSKTLTTGNFIAISNTGAVASAININNNHLGNSTGGLISFSAAYTGTVTGISNTGGAATADLHIQGNDFQGITQTAAASSAHTYITNSAATLSQDISSNTFTNLNVNTTGNVTFIIVNNGLTAAGVQNVSSNSIVTGFNKAGAGGTVVFCNGTGTSASGSVITHNLNNFSNVTVPITTLITGWINSNTSLNKTFSTNTFSNWSGNSTALTVMSITGGSSTVTGNIINNISTGTAAAAPIIAISTGAAGAIAVTNNTISNLVTGTAAFVNSFTGITNNAGVNVSITGNTITGCTAGGTLGSTFTGITVITAGSGTLDISGNSILSGTNSGTGAFTAISNSQAFTTANISDNIIRSNTISATTGTFTAISNTGAVTTTININNNHLGNTDGGLITYSAANAGALFGINNTGGAATCALTIQGNDILGITHSVGCTQTNTYISNAAATLSQSINTNTFTDLSVNTTGAILFISDNVAMPANGVQNINGNSIVTGFTNTAASGATTLFNSLTATNNTGVTVNNNSNNFSNITVNGAATISGWLNTDAGTASVTKTINGNTFSNWIGGTGTITVLNPNITSANNAISNNNINNISSAGAINGILSSAGSNNIFSNDIHTLVTTATASALLGISITSGTLQEVYQNTIYDLRANSLVSGSISGIGVSGGTTNLLFRNKVYNLSSINNAINASGTLCGIRVSGATASQTTTIHNNVVGQIQASAANITNPIYGIGIINTGTTSTNNVYYNTIYLNASSTGTNFGSSGIYHAASTTATTAALNLRNNIIINNSTPSGTGLTVAFRRSVGSANTLANFNGTSNNNLFYAGTPSASRLIYSDGTSTAQTIATYKAGAFTAGTISPRDQVSITENVRFLSTTGSDPNYLMIGDAGASYVESAGAVIAGFDVDYEGDIRSGSVGYPTQVNGFGTAPDIGADEFDGFTPHLSVSNSNANSDGYYGTLKYAFDGINAQDQTGKSIQVSMLQNTTETTSAILNGGNWTSLSVFPTLTNLSISGNLSGAPIIDLNGADNVNIDGRVNQTGSTASLSISNTSTSATAGTSTIRFMNSAENNTVEYCNITGSTTSASDGIITFSTSSGGNGNDNNTIDLCNITNAGGNRPLNGIYSLGTSGSENSLNTISNSNIYDFLNTTATSQGIDIGAYSTDWTVSGNSFYETTAFVPTAGTRAYNVLLINNPTGKNFTVTGNYFGGQAALCTGSAWSVNAATNHSIQILSLNVGTTTPSSVQNNTFAKWSYQSASATPWCALALDGGAVNVGTVTANTIGSDVGTGSIMLTSTINAESFGIKVGSTGTVNISNNKIGSFNLIGNSTTVSHSFSGIFKTTAAGVLTVSNNWIGSTGTASSINASSTAATASIPQFVRGIGSQSTGTVGISQNTVANLVSASSTGSVIGIDQNGSNATCTISKNSLTSLSNSGSAFTGFVAGINFTGTAGTNAVTSNFINNLTVNPSTTAASIYGIRIASGSTTYSNNIVNLGGNTATTLYGIYEAGLVSNNNKLYFNTIYLGGTLGSGITNKSYALYSNAAANMRDFRNNIFANFRSTTAGANLHYATYLNYVVNTNLTLDYNDYYTPGTGGVLGFFNGSNQTALPLATGQDSKSFRLNPSFVSAGTANATDYKVTIPLIGVSGTGIASDYEATTRNVPVNMGAFEYYTNKWKGTISSAYANTGNWTSSSIPTGTDKTGISSETLYQPVISGVSPGNDVDLTGSGRFDLCYGATLTLQNGPLLTIESGFAFKTWVGSRIILNSGARYLNLSASAPTLQVQRALTTSKGWRMVSSPVKESVAGMFKFPLVTQGFTGSSFPNLQPNLLWWLESDGGTTLQSWREPTNQTDSIVPGRGYFHYVFNGAGRLNADGSASGSNYSDAIPTTMSSTGVENFNGTGTFNYTLTYTAKGTQTPSVVDTTYYDLNSLDQGWNLLGNPTASTLDWNAAGWTKTSMDNTIYIWDPSALSGNGDFLTWNGTTGTLGNGRIAPFQAFWTHATAPTTLRFTNAVKTGTAGSFLRSAEVDETVSLPITLTIGDLQTTSYLSFSNNGIIGPDSWDAYRLTPMSDNWLELYTLSSQGHVSPLVINHLPKLEETLVDIPLYYDAQINGSKLNSNCTLSWTLPDNWPSDWNISLQDHQTEESISMTEHSEYSYNTTSINKNAVLPAQIPIPKKLVLSLADSSMLRSTASLPPFSIILSKGKVIDYMAPKPQLLGNFPNPFEKASTIRFSLPDKAKVSIAVYTSQGQKIASLADGSYPAGITEVTWNAKNNAPGLYFIRFLCNETVETKKAILIN